MTRLCLAATVSIAAIFAMAGCKKDKDKGSTAELEPSETEKETETETTAEADAAPKPAEPAMLNKMKHCPSAVAGAHTTIEKTGGAVVAIVIGKDKPATDTIRERARAVAEREIPAAADPEHTGEGSGGAVGKCPSRAPGAVAEFEEIKGGAKLTFTPGKADEAGAIFEMLQVRARALNDRGGRPHGSGGGRGAGGGHGGHGSTGRGGR